MKRIGRYGSTSVMLLAVMAAALLLTPAGPAGAVLPPGAHESLAADAPVVVIAGVKGVREVQGALLAECQVLAPGRGNLESGRVIQVLVDRPPAQRRVGPASRYHQLAKGQVWLLLLNNPDPYFKKFGPQLGGAYHIASHGWYTTRLDNLASSEELKARLMGMFSGKMGKDEMKLIKIYQWAGAWLDQQPRR